MRANVKGIILDALMVTTKPLKQGGGQSVGSMQQIVIVESQELGIKIELCYHRSTMKNKELGIQMIEDFIDKYK